MEYDRTDREDDMRSKGKSGVVFTQNSFEHKWVMGKRRRCGIYPKLFTQFNFEGPFNRGFELKWVNEATGQGS